MAIVFSQIISIANAGYSSRSYVYVIWQWDSSCLEVQTGKSWTSFLILRTYALRDMGCCEESDLYLAPLHLQSNDRSVRNPNDARHKGGVQPLVDTE